jgi:hypothetical protein
MPCVLGIGFRPQVGNQLVAGLSLPSAEREEGQEGETPTLSGATADRACRTPEADAAEQRERERRTPLVYTRFTGNGRAG